MGEIEPQVAEECLPAVGVPLELIIPFVRASEPTVNHAHDAGSAGTSLDDPLCRDCSGSFHGLDRVAVWRIPCLDGANRVHARTEASRGGAADALFDCAWNEPGRDARASRDGLPDFLRATRNLNFGLDRPAAGRIFLHWHGCSLVLDACGRGCATST